MVILIAFSVVLVIMLILHSMTIVSTIGYKPYIKAIKALLKFKQVDLKTSHYNRVVYNINGRKVPPSSYSGKDKCLSVSRFYFIDKCNYIEIRYNDISIDGHLRIIKGFVNHNTKNIETIEVLQTPFAELIAKFLINRIKRKMKSKVGVNIDNILDIDEILADALIGKYRETNLDKLI